MIKKNLNGIKKTMPSFVPGDYTPPTDEERKEVERLKQLQEKVEMEDEIIKFYYYVNYDPENPQSYEEYKENYLKSKK
jgi:hypothetical protein